MRQGPGGGDWSNEGPTGRERLWGTFASKEADQPAAWPAQETLIRCLGLIQMSRGGPMTSQITLLVAYPFTELGISRKNDSDPTLAELALPARSFVEQLALAGFCIQSNSADRRVKQE